MAHASCLLHPSPQTFLSLCQGNHYQFDTLRRAKHSSMMVLYHLHNPHSPAFASSCNVCNAEIEAGTGFRCTVCPDFDICASCKFNVGHPHLVIVSGGGSQGSNASCFSLYTMRREGSSCLSSDLVPDNALRWCARAHSLVCCLTRAAAPLVLSCPRSQPHQRALDETRQRLTEAERRERSEQMQKTLALLVHACNCNGCSSNSCAKVKQLFQHAVNCQARVTGNCQLCKKMWCLLNLHAKGCTRADCRVPRCK
jgi:hypothetical protein